jgi:alkylhydroperoxidase family enzyme
MKAFIGEPRRIPLPLRLGIWFSERVAGRIMLPARILAWYPKAAIGSGALEALVAHEDGRLDRRILKLVRMAASFSVACPFCIDMNSYEYDREGISDSEMAFLRSPDGSLPVSSLSTREILAIEYARLVSRTPLRFRSDFVERLRAEFGEREIVVLASTAAQVNYWARLIQALGIPPAGFMEEGEEGG